jgi:hypothetical protein
MFYIEIAQHFAMSDTQSEDDGDLRKAIKISLQDLPPSTADSTKEVIELQRDSEMIPTIDLCSSDSEKRQAKSPSQNETNKPIVCDVVPRPISGMLGLDRKQMEMERLARARKRKASESPPQYGKHEKKSAKAGDRSIEALVCIHQFDCIHKSLIEIAFVQQKLREIFRFGFVDLGHAIACLKILDRGRE